VLTKNDSCDIYLLLENKETTDIKRIATGWFRNAESIAQFKEITIPLTYGMLPPGSPAYMYPANNLFGNSNDKVTHISFVAASSAYGALFEGGTNSSLILNNLILNY